jgi:hypothetical protein
MRQKARSEPVNSSMKYAIDTEFLDTPTCSALISLGIVDETLHGLYFEFDYPADQITPWLAQNVVPHLNGSRVTFEQAAKEIRAFVKGTPEFWLYYGAYDWYWFCRLFGGFMAMPEKWPNLYRELAYLQQGLPNVAGAEHNALNDAISTMVAVQKRHGHGPV